MSRKYTYDNYTYSTNVCLLKKNYGDIEVTVIIDRRKAGKKESKNKAITVLMDEMGLLLNDPELEELLNPLL